MQKFLFKYFFDVHHTGIEDESKVEAFIRNIFQIEDLIYLYFSLNIN
jgi:hypothetical protein